MKEWQEGKGFEKVLYHSLRSSEYQKTFLSLAGCGTPNTLFDRGLPAWPDRVMSTDSVYLMKNVMPLDNYVAGIKMISNSYT